ncbi:MAG: N-acetylglucosamine transferase [Terricaulis sp.]
MSENAFLSAIQKITTGGLALNELIAAAQQLTQTGQPDLARQLYQVWLSSNREHPLSFIAYFNCSTLLGQLGDADGADAALRSALEVNPDFAPAHINLGSALERRGAVKEAVEQWKTGLDRMSAVTGDAVEYKSTLLKQISRVASDSQQHESAEAALLQCLDLTPDQRDVAEQYAAVRLAQCKWPILRGAPKLPRAKFLSRFHPLSACAFADDPLFHLALAARYVEALTPLDGVTTSTDRRHAQVAPGNRKLRVGYVSSDLRQHAVGYLIAQLFEAHDPGAIDVHVYYSGPPADDVVAQRIKAAVPRWTNIRALSDDDAAEAIANDEIDILIDVNGHTRDARLGVFARRPAPIQVNWLGYPGTMGSAFHHYIIADDWVIPEALERYYSERVLRLPCYQPNDRKRVVADHVATREEAGLPEDAFVYCCFNAPHKITRYSFERWMEILKGAPNSVLWLLDYGAETNQRLTDYAAAQGVDPGRIVFAKKLANPYHLARYPLADLFIDTVPYGAHTTASDALWMGVPVLTLTGQSFASRVCGSLLNAADVPELACATPEEFVARAIALAGSNRVQLRDFHERLVANRDSCALFDIDGLARGLEGLYRQMSAEHRNGALPKPRLDNLSAYLDVALTFDHDETEIGTTTALHAFYREGLASRHRKRPIAPDALLWSAEEIEAADAPPALRAQNERAA